MFCKKLWLYYIISEINFISVHTESRLAQPNQVPVQPEATQVNFQ